MTTFIALLRGINVGGHKRIKMVDLRCMLENLGLAKVQTYIQSGNVLFKAEGDADVLRRRIEQEIQVVFGFNIPVIIRTAKELDKLIENCPLERLPGLNVGFLAEKPTQKAVDEILACDGGNDEFYIKNTDIYVLYRVDIRKTLLTTNFFEKRLKVPLTMRNWNTVTKLAAIGKETNDT